MVASVLRSRPDWQLILQFLQVLTWPAVVVFGLITVRPGRIIDAILENGGELAAGGASIRLSKRIDEVAASIRSDDDPTETAEAPPANPLGDDADRYTTIMNGWGLVVMALEDAVDRAALDPVNGLGRWMPSGACGKANGSGQKLSAIFRRCGTCATGLKAPAPID